MNVISATEFTFSPRKRRTDAPQLLPGILLFLASLFGLFPRLCLSLKIFDLGSTSSPQNNNGSRNFCRRRRKFTAEAALSLRTTTSLPSSLSPFNVPDEDDALLSPASLFPTHRPLLAIITETDACDTEEKMKSTYATVKKAASTGKVDLVSVRLSLPHRYDEKGNENYSYNQILERACRLTKELVALALDQKQEQQLQSQNKEHEDGDAGASQQLQSSRSFIVVCSSDLVSVAVNACAHGVHVKEHHLDQLPDIIGRFEYPIVIGTSTHSVESALRSFCFPSDSSNLVQNSDEGIYTRTRKVARPTPHYYFVGTCYLTASHPEKTSLSQLEGPQLPGRVKQALLASLGSKERNTITAMDETLENVALQSRCPRIIAIGGIDETNCHEPISLGADGVAVIRAVSEADHPLERVEEMQSNMMRAYTHDL